MASALSDIGCDGAIDATIRNEIIPRLMLAFRESGAVERGFSADDSATIAQMAFDGDDAGAAAHLDALTARGVGLDAVFLDVLAPAARQIGAAWETDERGFAEVSVALTRIHRLFRERQPRFQDGGRSDGVAGRALIAPSPGEHHILGALIVEAFFTRAGWMVQAGRFDDVHELASAVRDAHYDLVGLSVGRTAAIDDCRAAVAVLRAQSANPNVFVMAGGEGVRRSGVSAADLGVDAIADDAAEAVDIAESLRVSSRVVTAG